jgi:DNA polymerase III gamma/tau subunit
LNQLFARGYEPGTIGKDLLEYFRRCMILKIDSKIERVLGIPDEQVADILQQVQKVKLEHLIHSVTRVEALLMRLKNSFHSKILLETELVKLAQGEKFFEVESLEKRICELEVRISQLARKGGRPNVPARQLSSGQKLRAPSYAEDAPPPTYVQEDKPINTPFSKFLSILGKRSPICSALLTTGKMVGVDDGHLKLAVSQDFIVKKLRDEKNYALLLAVAKEVFGEIKSVIVVNPVNEKKNSLNNVPKTRISHQEEIAKIDEGVRQKLLAKPAIADAVEVFGGEIVKIDS